MTYCSHCGLIIETYDCPVCGFKNFRPEKSEKSANPPNPALPNQPKPAQHPHDIQAHYASPKRSAHMLAGGIGSFIMAIAAIILGILPLYNSFNGGWKYFNSEVIYLLYIFGTLIFIIGSSVLIGGLYGLFRHYDGYQGLVALMFSLISPIILLVFTFLAIENDSHSMYHNYYSYSFYSIGWELWIGHLFVGIMFMLIGISWRSIYFRIGYEQPNLPVGSLFIFSGILFILFVGFTGTPWIMISIASMAAGVLFLLGRAGTDNIPASRPNPMLRWTTQIPDLSPPRY